MRFFTVAAANAMLPQLTEDIAQMQALLAAARAHDREIQMFKAVGYRDDGQLIMEADHQKTRAQLKQTVAELEAVIAAVNDRGCQLKDIDRGLVDFPAILDGQEVLLCWRLGEPEVAFFHDPYSGFSGRQPL